MCRICPKCGGIAEFSAYYGGRVRCTRCDWQSEKLKDETEAEKYSCYPNREYEESLHKEKEVAIA